MNSKLTVLLLLTCLMINCKEAPKEEVKPLTLLETITSQYDSLYQLASPIVDRKKSIPRTVNKEGELVAVGPYDWTSGFYAGTLWNLYGLTKEEKWKERALIYTEKLDSIQYWSGNHDVGFMIECSYGNSLKYNDSKAYDSIIVQTAKSLLVRFRPNAGVLQSWEASDKWKCPVIIDNMMNLELLFHATKITGDSTYYKHAVIHADTTIKNHFREDYSTFHVVDYDTETGKVVQKNTHQGYSDDSAWARGQAWGLYGYTLTYKHTKNPIYLKQAQGIANFIMNNSSLPEDKVPYWDYNVPNSDKSTPRDASAAAIAASALYDLSTFVSNDKSKTYKNLADKIMSSLSSSDYLAKLGTNKGFILEHSVGSKPHEVEIDVPLNYADYYFTEALLRKRNLD